MSSLSPGCVALLVRGSTSAAGFAGTAGAGAGVGAELAPAAAVSAGAAGGEEEAPAEPECEPEAQPEAPWEYPEVDFSGHSPGLLPHEAFDGAYRPALRQLSPADIQAFLSRTYLEDAIFANPEATALGLMHVCACNRDADFLLKVAECLTLARCIVSVSVSR
jgi:hypothetical protein